MTTSVKRRSRSDVKRRRGFPYVDSLVDLTLSTHLPTKWMAVDLEHGEAWTGTLGGQWTRPSEAEILRLKRTVEKLGERA